MSSDVNPGFYLVGTPIGNLEDMTLRALRVLREVDLIFCEDTRRSLKLLSHFEIQKPLKSCPYFKERKMAEVLCQELQEGKRVAFVSDAGMPGVSDPGATLLAAARKAGFHTEIIGGVSSISHFVSLLGRELDSFKYVGFLPEKSARRKRFLEAESSENLLFFESTHRLESSLAIMVEINDRRWLSLAKEMSKISEALFEGYPSQLLKTIPSWKGEWVGLWWKAEYEFDS